MRLQIAGLIEESFRFRIESERLLEEVKEVLVRVKIENDYRRKFINV